MSSGNFIVTVKCQHCNTVYMLVKYARPSIGQVTNPNPGQPCPGCQKNTPAIVVAVAQER
jgi:hypothetical protein